MSAMYHQPMVSIIMPCYNSEAFLGEAIESCINQSYQNWELIIVDDGSSDNSLLITRKFEDKRIHVYSQPNRGACVARNRALQMAKGEFVKFLDADDVLAKDCLAIQVQQMQSLKESQIPFGDYDFIDIDGNQIYQYSFDGQDDLNNDQEYFFYSHWEVLISTPLHRRCFLEKIGGFDEKLPRGQEYDLHFRLANAGCEFVYCPVQTFSYRSHNSVHRISTGTKKRTYETSAYLAYIYDKFEDLLKARHGFLPVSFESSFFHFWFGRARDAYARKLKNEGDNDMKHAERYKDAHSSFYKMYKVLGTIMGYVFLEKCLRLRVRLLGKKNEEKPLTGIARYI